MADGPGFASRIAREVIRETGSIDVDVRSAEGSMWVVIGLELDGAEPRAVGRTADAAVLFDDRRGGVTLEGIERACPRRGSVEIPTAGRN